MLFPQQFETNKLSEKECSAETYPRDPRSPLDSFQENENYPSRNILIEEKGLFCLCVIFKYKFRSERHRITAQYCSICFLKECVDTLELKEG